LFAFDHLAMTGVSGERNDITYPTPGLNQRVVAHGDDSPTSRLGLVFGENNSKYPRFTSPGD
jgi:hypothetical protein